VSTPLLLITILLLALLSLSAAVQDTLSFRQWMSKFNKSYKNEDEFQYRLQVWLKNSAFINQHNNAGKSFTVGMNQFGDLTNQEFRSSVLGYNKAGRDLNHVKSNSHVVHSTSPIESIPPSFDWRTKGAVTGIKNQGDCGSCWAFSTTGSTEGCHAISTGKLVSLSEQNIMDCSDAYGNEGCDGGWMTQAFEYIINNKGVDTESSYPYQGEDGTCHFSKKNIGATLTSYVNVTSGDENDLLTEAVNGPVSIAMDAGLDSFQFYTSGVYSDPDCGNNMDSLDHGVLVIGWGALSNGTDYWIVKNSWGTDWGLNGYFWLARNDNNMCGVATAASRPEC